MKLVLQLVALLSKAFALSADFASSPLKILTEAWHGSALLRPLVLSSSRAELLFALLPWFHIGQSSECIGCKLTSPHDDQNDSCGTDQHPGPNEPAQISKREKERLQAGREVASRYNIHVGRRRGFTRTQRGIIVGHYRADQDGRIVEQPVRPSNLVEGVPEDNRQSEHLHLPREPRGRKPKRHLGEEM